MKNPVSTFLLILSILLFACEQESSIMTPKVSKAQSQSIAPMSLSIPFDWETAEFVNNDPTQPRLPWTTGASTAVPRSLSLDMKKDDGWVMMHNGFLIDNGSTEQKFIMLYNRWRGVLRVWYYHTGQSAYTSLKYGLTSTASTSLLNFNSEFALPMDDRIPNRTVERVGGGSQGTIVGTGLTDKTWYLFEYIMSYDNANTRLNITNNDLLFYTRGINITSLSASGTSETSTIGDIVLSSSSNNLLNLGALSISGGTINNVTGGKAMEVTNNPASWWKRLGNKLSTTVLNKVGDAGGALAKSGLDLLTNPIGGLLNSLVHQGTSQEGKVHLQSTSKINLEGSLTTQYPVQENNFYIPGSQVSPDRNLIYLYDQPLGVFNITTTPTVTYGETYYIRPTSTRYHQFFRLERGSFSIEFNPALAGQMTVLETKSELYYYEKYSGNLGGNRPLYLGQVTVNGNDLVNEEYNNNVLANRWYKIAEGVTPIAISRSVADLYGIYNNLNTRPNSYPTLGPDGRVVVKVTVVIRENRTGNKITHVRTYIPKFSANCMTIQTVYYN